MSKAYIRGFIALDVILLAICIVSIILTLSNLKQNGWLIVFFAGIASPRFFSLIGPSKLMLVEDIWFFQTPSTFLLSIPATYFYVLKLIKPEESIQKLNYLFFIPFSIAYAIHIYCGRPIDIEFSEDNLVQVSTVSVLVALLTPIIIIRIKKSIDGIDDYLNEYSSVDKYLSLSWIKTFFWILAILSCTIAITQVLFYIFEATFDIRVIALALIVISSIFSYHVFNQKPLYRIKDSNKLGMDLKTYDVAIAGKIEQILDHQPYLNPKIRMSEIARDMDIPLHEFSRTLNLFYGHNFSRVMNELRVNHSKKLLLDGKNLKYTLATISQMSGFNSESTFYIRFKELEGCTPKQFLESNV